MHRRVRSIVLAASLFAPAGNPSPARANRRLRPAAVAAGVALLAMSVVGVAEAGWQSFSTTDGLLNNTPTQILEDNSGTYWVGFEFNGLQRFDGRTWTRFDFPDGRNYGVQRVLQDRSGGFWFARGDLEHWDGTEWTSFDWGSDITAIIEDHLGRIWVATQDKGVRCFDGTSWTTYDVSSGLWTNSVSDIAEDHSGNIWFSSFYFPGGVTRFDGTAWTTFMPAPGLQSGWEVNDIAVDQSNNVWFSSNMAVTRFDGSGWVSYKPFPGAGIAGTGAVGVDRFGNVWVGGILGGVARFDGQEWQTYGAADGVPLGRVSDISIDRLGNVWFCIDASGLVRFDGTEWKSEDPYGVYGVQCSLLDHTGRVWFGTQRRGLIATDGLNWFNYGLVGVDIRGLAEDSNGTIWVATTTGAWQLYSGNLSPMTLPNNDLRSVATDSDGNLWFGHPGGVTRFDGADFTTFPTNSPDAPVQTIVADHSDVLFGGYGLQRYHKGVFSTIYGAPLSMTGLFVDASGDIWATASTNGNSVTRFDGTSWSGFRDPLGSISTGVAGGSDGVIWVSTFGNGIAMIQGSEWRTFSSAEGLGNSYATTILVDRTGAIWVGTNVGITRYRPDRVAPRTVVVTRPPTQTSARDIAVGFAAAFSETRGIEFSTRFDGQGWSAWGSASSWSASAVPDGLHRLEIQARDHSLNVEAAPAVVSFEIDGTPPAPILTAPAFGQVVRGAVSLVGSVADARLLRYSVAIRPSGVASWSAPEVETLVASSVPVAAGALATWNTALEPDGAYDIQVSETDSLGLVGIDFTSVIVDNLAPYNDETAPARISAATGGDVYTTNAETHLYFPPHAFTRDAMVTVVAEPAGSAPATLPTGAAKVLDGYELEWNGVLEKPARFTLSYAGASLPPGTLALYRSHDGANWERLGGTLDAGEHSISLAVTSQGRYALFADNGQGAGTADLSPIAFVPRVFSPSGGFADSQVGISFTLSRPAPVTVKVFSRSGRLVREVATGLSLSAGANLIRWDGRDRNGGYVTDGVYLVTVEALDRVERNTLAVVR